MYIYYTTYHYHYIYHKFFGSLCWKNAWSSHHNHQIWKGHCKSVDLWRHNLLQDNNHGNWRLPHCLRKRNINQYAHFDYPNKTISCYMSISRNSVFTFHTVFAPLSCQVIVSKVTDRTWRPSSWCIAIAHYPLLVTIFSLMLFIKIMRHPEVMSDFVRQNLS